MTLANQSQKPSAQFFHEFKFTTRGGLEGEKYMPQSLFPLQRGYKGAEPL
jgi:hypothetical protein